VVRVGFALCLVVAYGLALSPGLAARPLVPAERQFLPYVGDLPPCDDGAVLARIQSRFRASESEYWGTGLGISGFSEIREIGYRTNGLDHIPRRYCTALAVLIDRKTYPLTYNIIEDGGIIGFGFGVEWCLVGLDRLYAFAPHCKMAAP
jgi:hypothetical protein